MAYKVLTIFVSIPNGHPQPFSLGEAGTKGTENVRFQFLTDIPSHLASSTSASSATTALFQFLTDIPSHLAMKPKSKTKATKMFQFLTDIPSHLASSLLKDWMPMIVGFNS